MLHHEQDPLTDLPAETSKWRVAPNTKVGPFVKVWCSPEIGFSTLAADLKAEALAIHIQGQHS